MLISFSALVLTSQLLITVADTVPNYNIQRGCRVDDTNTASMNMGLDETTKSCIKDEQNAKDQLQTQWSQFGPSARAQCAKDETDISGIPPSYVELLTCLQAIAAAKKLN
jgi:hypothetical protein